MNHFFTLSTALDPRMKLLIVLWVSLVSFLTENVLLLVLIFLGSLITLFITPVSTRMAWRTVRPIVQASVPIFLVQLTFHEPKGDPLVLVPSVSPFLSGTVLVGDQALSTAVTIILRMLVIALVSVIFAMTTDQREFLQSLIQLKIPYSIAFTTSMVLYLLPLIREEVDTVSLALRARGVTRAKGIISTLAYLRLVFVTTFLNFLDRTYQQSLVLDSRGFRLFRTRTTLNPVQFSPTDALVFLGLAFMSAIYVHFTWWS